MASDPPPGGPPGMNPLPEDKHPIPAPITPLEKTKTMFKQLLGVPATLEPIPGDKGGTKPPPIPRKGIQAHINRLDPQGSIFTLEQGPDCVSETAVMHPIIFDLLKDEEMQGPIRSALDGLGYTQPHQIVLCEPHLMTTNRTINGEYSEEDLPLPPHMVHKWQLLQAYHNAYLMGDAEDPDNFFLDWQTWMQVKHDDLVAFHLLTKKRKAEN